jgi:hypothetical protein
MLILNNLQHSSNTSSNRNRCLDVRESTPYYVHLIQKNDILARNIQSINSTLGN